MNGKYLPCLSKDSREELLIRVRPLETSGAVRSHLNGCCISPQPTPLWLVAIWRGVECPGVLLVLVLGLGGLTLDSAHVRQLEHLPTQRGSAGFKPWNIFHKICKYFSAICRCRMCRSFKTRTAPSSLPCWLMYPGGDDGGGSICVYSALYSARQMSRSRPTDNLPHYSNYQSQATLLLGHMGIFCTYHLPDSL